MSRTRTVVKIPPEVHFEGNKGATYIRLVATDIDGIVELEIGHDCVVQMKERRVRVTDIAMALLRADRVHRIPQRSSEGQLNDLGWD